MRPGGQHHVLRQAAFVEAAVGVFHHQHDRGLGAGQVAAKGPQVASLVSVSRSRTTITCHGWVFFDEPVQRATSRTSSKTSSGMA